MKHIHNKKFRINDCIITMIDYNYLNVIVNVLGLRHHNQYNLNLIL